MQFKFRSGLPVSVASVLSGPSMSTKSRLDLQIGNSACCDRLMWYLVPGTWYQVVPGPRYKYPMVQVGPGTVPGTCIYRYALELHTLVPGTKYQGRSTRDTCTAYATSEGTRYHTLTGSCGHFAVTNDLVIFILGENVSLSKMTATTGRCIRPHCCS